MTKPNCPMPGCTSGQLVYARGRCSPCYQRWRKHGHDYAPSKDVSTYHRLTDVDGESKTATCSICGHTRIVRGGQHEAKRDQDYRWRCITKNARGREFCLQRDYGLTRDEYEAMHEAQGGLCAICRRPQGSNRELAVDHCHDTGRVRGLLCWNCNSAIGLLGDTFKGIIAAVEYLRPHHKLSD